MEHGLSQKAVEIARPFGFPITNSMVVMWIVAIALILFAQNATRTMKQVPDGPQNLLEWLIEGLYRFLEGIIGFEHNPKVSINTRPDHDFAARYESGVVVALHSLFSLKAFNNSYCNHLVCHSISFLPLAPW